MYNQPILIPILDVKSPAETEPRPLGLKYRHLFLNSARTNTTLRGGAVVFIYRARRLRALNKHPYATPRCSLCFKHCSKKSEGRGSISAGKTMTEVDKLLCEFLLLKITLQRRPFSTKD